MLPPGRYRASRHFAEIYLHPPAERVFGVILEGSRVLVDYKPGKKGFAAADRRSFKADVADGLLDVLFIPGKDLPRISAIEVERLPPG